MKKTSIAILILLFLSGCVTAPRPEPVTMKRPVITDTSETHWRMYYENQFSVYGNAPPPPPDAPDAAWRAYYAERDSFNIRMMRMSRTRQKEECFIATAAYGTHWERNVVKLRSFRNRYLLTNNLGSQFIDWYYHTSPPVASFISDKSWARFVTRLALTPLVILAGAMLGDTTDAILLTLTAIALGVVVFLVWRSKSSSITLSSRGPTTNFT